VRSSKERDIVFDLVGREAGSVLQAAESADTREDRVRLGTTVAWQSVVPEALVRPFDWSLVLVMAVGVGRAHKSGGSEGEVLHDCDKLKNKVDVSCL